MASLMTGYAETGITTGKFIRRRQSDGAFWNGSAFAAYSAANIATYAITATETGASGIYTATDPADTVLGDYLFVKAAGATLTVSDLSTGVRWQDTAGPIAVTATVDSATIAADILASLGTGRITYTGPVNNVNGRMTLTRGDDYYNADSRALNYTVPVGSGNPDLTGATVTASWYAQSVSLTTNQVVTEATPAFTASVTVTNPGLSTQALMIELSKAQTTLLTGDRYIVTIVAALADGHRDTFSRQTCIVVNP